MRESFNADRLTRVKLCCILAITSFFVVKADEETSASDGNFFGVGDKEMNYLTSFLPSLLFCSLNISFYVRSFHLGHIFRVNCSRFPEINLKYLQQFTLRESSNLLRNRILSFHFKYNHDVPRWVVLHHAIKPTYPKRRVHLSSSKEIGLIT